MQKSWKNLQKAVNYAQQRINLRTSFRRFKQDIKGKILQHLSINLRTSFRRFKPDN